MAPQNLGSVVRSPAVDRRYFSRQRPARWLRSAGSRQGIVELRQAEGFEQKIDGIPPQSGDCVIDLFVAGHHDHGGPVGAGFGLVEKLPTSAVGQDHVTQHGVNGDARRQDFLGFLEALRFERLPALPFDVSFDDPSNGRVVVDYEDGSLHASKAPARWGDASCDRLEFVGLAAPPRVGAGLSNPCGRTGRTTYAGWTLSRRSSSG